MKTITVTHSRRTISKNLTDLVNRLYGKYGKRIQWPQRPDDDTAYWGDGYIDTGSYLICFRGHGNQYAGYLEVYSYDQKLMEQVKQDFPKDFPNRLITKEGI